MRRACWKQAVAALFTVGIVFVAGCTSADDDPSPAVEAPVGASAEASETTVDVGRPVDGERQIVRAETVDFQLRYVLRAQVQTRPVVPIDLTEDLVWEISAPAGARVAEGDVIASGRASIEERQSAARALEDAEIELEVARQSLPDGSYDRVRYSAAMLGLDRAQEDLDAINARERTVTSPTEGTIQRGLDTVAVVPVGLVVVAQLTPVQALRLLGVELTAVSMVETPSGRSNQACVSFGTGVGVGGEASAGEAPAPETSTEVDSVGGDATEYSAYAATCQLAPGAPTVAGLPAKLRVEAPTIKNAVVVPESAIRYRDDTGTAYVEVNGDKPREVDVVLGPSNGLRRVVTSGIEEGTSIVVDPVAQIGESDLGGG